MNASSTPATVVEFLVRNVREQPDKPAIWFRRSGGIVERTWSEIGRDVVRAGQALASLGVTPGDRVAFISSNRYEWPICDLAILGIGAVHLPIHNTLTGPQMRFQIADSGARVVIVAGDEQAAKLAAADPLPPNIRFVSLDATKVPLGGAAIPQLSELAALPDDAAFSSGLDRLATATRADALATILYTSGTTGEPKGVMLSHGNLASNAAGMVRDFDGPNESQSDRRLNMLPLSHIFARTCDLYACLVGASELAFADSPQTAVADSVTFHPTFINAVPYFYEKVMRTLIDDGRANIPGALPEMLGGHLRCCCSGGAPLPTHVAQFFVEHGLLLIQGYGLTESSPVITMNTPRVFRHGTIGRPLSGVEVRIGDDGEILSRGPQIMLGYWNRPEETAAALQDGWLHTGDLGEIDADGFVRITGRKKELIVTSGGKKIVPSAVESLLTSDTLIRQAAVIGDGRNYLTALVVPNRDALAAALVDAGHAATSDDACRHPAAEALVLERIRLRTTNLSHYEQVRRIALVEREFSVEREELTLTMKMRRATIAANFAAEIERLYAADAK
ncbi:MAG: long-chain fatty acid--CoA ligase [Planctomycetales bacterium]|nr:long-chain fatty acid--CoA ligase [Planctomycetales bacterium]